MTLLASLKDPRDNAALFRNCVLISLAAHGLFWFAAHGFAPSAPPPDEIEIDLSKPLGTGPAKLGAPKKSSPLAVPQANPVPVETPPPVVPPQPVVAPPVPAKDWVLPGPSTKVIEKPAPALPSPGGSPDGTGTASKLGGSGLGADDGVPGGTGDGGNPLSAWPRLLNRDEVMESLQKYYPESERRAGHEGTVKVKIHIGVDGSVSSADVVESAGAAFDGAAQQVAKLMKFSPALGLFGKPVPVRLPQKMVFQLKD